ncbi:MAG: hypothetical protein OD918_10560 [Gammaproteobacteria bacterium]
MHLRMWAKVYVVCLTCQAVWQVFDVFSGESAQIRLNQGDFAIRMSPRAHDAALLDLHGADAVFIPGDDFHWVILFDWLSIHPQTRTVVRFVEQKKIEKTS